MTLNVTLVSRHAAYLSSDFRTTNVVTSGVTDDLRTQKLVPLIRHGWSAMIGYTGIAGAPGIMRDTGDWLLERIDSLSMKATPDDLFHQLLTADRWLGRVPIALRRHAFVVVGFVGRRPFLSLISNFHAGSQQLAKANPKLQIFKLPAREPTILVTGATPAVRVESRDLLMSLLRRNASPQDLREALATINATASASEAGRGVSSQCVTGYLLPTGACEFGPHGIPENVPYIPGFIIQSFLESGTIGFEQKLDESGVESPPQWVGTTARSQSNDGDPNIVLWLHAMRNVGPPISDGKTRPGRYSAWKVAGPDEPDRYTFTLNKGPKSPPTAD